MLDDRTPSTFKSIYVQSGDIVYLPAGSIVCEKAVGAHNVMLRAYTTVLSDDISDSCMFIAGACHVKILGSFIVHFPCFVLKKTATTTTTTTNYHTTPLAGCGPLTDTILYTH